MMVCHMLHLIKLMRAVAKRAPDRYIVAIYCCRDLIRKLLVQDRTKRLGNMKVCRLCSCFFFINSCL